MTYLNIFTTDWSIMKRIKNVGVDYVYCGLFNFSLSSAVWILYLAYRGMSLGEIGLLEGIFHVTSFFFEVPTGAMADLFGRKNMLLLGRILAISSSVLMLCSDQFWMFALSFVLSAASYNLNSGSEEALVYDSMKQVKREEEYLSVNGRLNFIIEVSQGASSFVGGVLSDISFTLTYICQIVNDLLAFFCGTFFEEPLVHEKQDTISLKKHAQGAYQILRQQSNVRAILCYYPVVFSFQTLTYFYGQQKFLDMGLSKTKIALIMLVSGVICSVAALTAKPFYRIFREKSGYLAAGIMGFCIFFFGWEHLGIAVASFFALNFFNALLYPISSNALNEQIPSEQRATILSINSMFFSVAMIVLFPLSGFLGDVFGLNKIFHGLGVLLFFFALFYGSILYIFRQK
ncbi:MAG: hypothetical protein PWP24_1304 [Clostridiales bacterium]|nr:hypothetical protein [Clostridiales bacterium]